MAAVFRAVFGYCFLIFVVRIVGRRPGKQLTPFEFILIFFLGGVTLTYMVGDEVSLTNALCQIATVAMVHFAITTLRQKMPRLARVLDGTPLVLMREGHWESRTMHNMGILDDDVMAAARDKGMKSLEQIDYAILERNGEISIIKKSDDK